jgi:hypothetical protein
MTAATSNQPLPARAYVRIALVGAAVFVVLFFVYLWLLPFLADRGEYFVRYVLFVVLGIDGAVILSAVMRSSSFVNYKERGFSVKVGGPAAVCFLIVWGGIKYVPDTPQTFDVTIRPQSAESAIITAGSVLIDLDSDRRTQLLSPNGEADFKQIPWRFRGSNVNVLPEIEGYEEKPQKVALSRSVITLTLVELPPPVTTLSGSIMLPKGEIRDLRILVEGQKGETSPDSYGRFEISVAGKPGDRVRVKVFVGERLEYDDFQTLPGPVTLKLHENR